jgi:hypothetical protein
MTELAGKDSDVEASIKVMPTSNLAREKSCLDRRSHVLPQPVQGNIRKIPEAGSRLILSSRFILIIHHHSII